ncbi:hypothetical protein Zmor_014823 [Zophobas morio]|uniref:Uncharacterized protein n=1 Tax=Zophobas morio TaxID=2755281 RepID=A0AA38MGY2_9CUCU|nr:hypothetical protein Zmor_014823 [Zophobas morio]
MLEARIIAECEIGNKSIRLSTDSKSALLALDSCMVRSRLGWECRQTLRYVMRRNNVELCYVTGGRKREISWSCCRESYQPIGGLDSALVRAAARIKERQSCDSQQHLHPETR